MKCGKRFHCSVQLGVSWRAVKVGHARQPRLDLPPPRSVLLQTASVHPAQRNRDRHASIRNVFQKSMQGIKASSVGAVRPTTECKQTFVAIEFEDRGAAEAARNDFWLAA
jgi:hypothetical protein